MSDLQAAPVKVGRLRKTRRRRALRTMLFERQSGLCHYCARKMILNVDVPQYRRQPKLMATLDHLVPLVRGGTNHESNLVLACFSCNSAKQDRDAPPAAFLAKVAKWAAVAARSASS